MLSCDMSRSHVVDFERAGVIIIGWVSTTERMYSELLLLLLPQVRTALLCILRQCLQDRLGFRKGSGIAPELICTALRAGSLYTRNARLLLWQRVTDGRVCRGRTDEHAQLTDGRVRPRTDRRTCTI